MKTNKYDESHEGTHQYLIIQALLQSAEVHVKCGEYNAIVGRDIFSLLPWPNRFRDQQTFCPVRRLPVSSFPKGK
jgi:hypothetical protein